MNMVRVYLPPSSGLDHHSIQIGLPSSLRRNSSTIPRVGPASDRLQGFAQAALSVWRIGDQRLPEYSRDLLGLDAEDSQRSAIRPDKARIESLVHVRNWRLVKKIAEAFLVPILLRVLANAPATLEAYANFTAALASGTLDERSREQIALTAAESNLCDYCLSAHAYIGEKVGLAPEEIAAAIAARTKRIRIASGGLLMPFHNPVRLAEDIAVVDVISGGRLELGVGVGFKHEEFEGFGVPFTERGARTNQSLEIIRRLLSGETVTFKSEFFDFKNVKLTPEPIQKPHRLYGWAASPPLPCGALLATVMVSQCQARPAMCTTNMSPN